MLKILQNLKYPLMMIVLLTSYISHAEIKYETRNITPSNLDEDHLGKEITCHRPMRRGAPNMSVELIGDKVVANNYGHGGSGWN